MTALNVCGAETFSEILQVGFPGSKFQSQYPPLCAFSLLFHHSAPFLCLCFSINSKMAMEQPAYTEEMSLLLTS